MSNYFEYFWFFAAGVVITVAVIISIQVQKKINWCEDRGLIALRIANLTGGIICIDTKLIVIPNLKEKQ